MNAGTAPPTTTAGPDAGERGWSPPRLPWPALVVAAAVAWWLLGHLSWLLDGLQPHWYGGLAAVELPDDTRLAVPLVTSLLPDLLVDALVGGLAAGLVGRLGRDRRGVSALATVAGLALAVAVAVGTSLQTLAAVPADALGQPPFGADERVVTALAGVTVAASLTGWLLGSLALLGRLGAAVPLAVLAGALPAWLFGLAQSVTADGELTTLGAVPTLAGAAVLAVALVQVGVRPPARALAWPLLLLAAWAVGPVLTAAGYLASFLRPAAGLPDSLPTTLSATVQVFGEAWSPGSRLVWPWVLAVALAVAVVRDRSERSRPPTLTR